MAPRRKLAFVLCFFIWCTIVPVFILTASVPSAIIYCYRLLVTQILRRIFRPDLGQPLTLFDFAFSTDDFYGKQIGAMTKTMIVDGTLDPKSIENTLSNLLDSGTQTGNPESADYTRLTQLYPSFWLGYPFWTCTKQKIQIHEHVKVFYNVENVDNVIEKWCTSPFTLGQPLWDVLVIPGFKHQDGSLKSVFGIRIHHSIADGLSLIYFGQKELLKSNEEEFGKQSNILIPTRDTTGVIIENICNTFWIPLVICHGVWYTILSRDALSNRIRDDELDISDVTLRLADLKALRAAAISKLKGSRVSFQSVFLMCLSGALRKFYLTEFDGNVKSDLKKGIRVTLSTTKRNPHPILMTPPSIANHWGVTFQNLPIWEPEPLKRLQDLIDQESFAKFSSLMQLPRGLTCLVSVLPPIKHQVYLCGHAVTKINAIPGLQSKQANLIFSAVTYKDDVVVTLTGRCGVFSRNSNSRLLQKYLVDEVKHLLASDYEEISFDKKKLLEII